MAFESERNFSPERAESTIFDNINDSLDVLFLEAGKRGLLGQSGEETVLHLKHCLSPTNEKGIIVRRFPDEDRQVVEVRSLKSDLLDEIEPQEVIYTFHQSDEHWQVSEERTSKVSDDTRKEFREYGFEIYPYATATVMFEDVQPGDLEPLLDHLRNATLVDSDLNRTVR